MIVRMKTPASDTPSSTFQDNLVPGTEWGALKPTTKFGQMPVLRLANGKELAQSQPMVRYLARTSTTPLGKSLYPIDDAYAAFQIDEYMVAVEDARNKLMPTFAIADQAEKEAARTALFQEGGAVFDGLKKLEGSLGNDAFMVGNKLSLADLGLFVTVNQCRAGFLDGIPVSGWLEKMPKLEKIVNAVAAVPEIKAYYTEKAAANKLYTPHASG